MIFKKIKILDLQKSKIKFWDYTSRIYKRAKYEKEANTQIDLLKGKIKILYKCCPYLTVLFKPNSTNRKDNFLWGLSDSSILEQYIEVKKEIELNPQVNQEIGKF